MNPFGNRAALALAATAAMAASVAAQQPAKQCEIDEGKFGKAILALQVAQSAATPAQAQKQLASVVKMVTENKDASANVPANWFLGRALVLWMSQPDIGTTANRGKLGYTTNPEGTVDLPTAIDSAFTVVETAQPECESNTAVWRAQKGWLNMVNAAIEQANTGSADSATALANRSLVLYRKAPYAYMVLGQLASKKGDVNAALENWDKTVQLSADTIYNDVRRQTLLNIGSTAADAADTATVAAQKTALFDRAKAAYTTLAADQGAGSLADQARAGIARIAMAQGDTVAIRATYKDQLANPTAFDYNALMNAGVNAARAEQSNDAISLFSAAYAKNPAHRDVLYNLALMYIKTNQYAKALPLIDALVKIDPSNGENYRLYAFTYAGIQKGLNQRSRDVGKRANAAKSPKLKRALIDSARVLGDSIPKVTDLAVRYNMLADTLPVQVQFNQFDNKSGAVTLGGRITNKGKADKTYTVVVEFVDGSGNVVDTQTATVGPVAPNAAASFDVKSTATNVTAFRYKPLQ